MEWLTRTIFPISLLRHITLWPYLFHWTGFQQATTTLSLLTKTTTTTVSVDNWNQFYWAALLLLEVRYGLLANQIGVRSISCSQRTRQIVPLTWRAINESPHVTTVFAATVVWLPLCPRLEMTLQWGTVYPVKLGVSQSLKTKPYSKSLVDVIFLRQVFNKTVFVWRCDNGEISSHVLTLLASVLPFRGCSLFHVITRVAMFIPAWWTASWQIKKY